MTDEPRPHVGYDEEPEGYPGASCRVCGRAPATLRLRWWRNPRGGGGRPVGARETADRQDAALRAPDG